MNSYVDADKIKLYHGFYSRDVILECSTIFEERLDVQISKVTKDFCEIKLILRDKTPDGQTAKAEFLNYLLGTSYQDKINKKCP